MTIPHAIAALAIGATLLFVAAWVVRGELDRRHAPVPPSDQWAETGGDDLDWVKEER